MAMHQHPQQSHSSATAAIAAATSGGGGGGGGRAQPSADLDANRRWRFPTVEVIALTVIALLLIACFAKGRGVKTWLVRLIHPGYQARPAVVSSNPATSTSNVALDAFVSVELDLPNDGKTVDPHTLPPDRPDSVRLVRAADRAPVPSIVNTTGAGDAIVLKPVHPLEPSTQYTFEVTPAVADTAGAAFKWYSASFTTVPASKPVDFPSAFERVALPTAANDIYTCVAIGPDHRLYVSAFDGRILRFDIQSDGTLSQPTTFGTLLKANHGPRLVTGFCFDPASTAAAPILWVSHGQLALQGSDDWTGTISRLSGASFENYRDAVVHLPRGTKDHLNNQPSFGPDGALYFGHPSNTAMGAPDKVWGWRPERLLSASILRLDVKSLGDRTLDVKTEGGGVYDPFSPGAPLTIYATGIRNGYDLLFHSNGRLYSPVNGSAAGGNAPASDDPRFARGRRLDTGKPYDGPKVPAVTNVQQTENDTLLMIQQHAYYGHPNPLRGEFALNGGNPTAGRDPHEVLAYPVGTKPDANFHDVAFDFGAHLSPTGVIEVKTPGALLGRVLITRYSGGDDVIVLSASKDGAITESVTGIDGLTSFNDPLDLAEDPRNGNLYVVEFGAKRLTLARPIPGGVSHQTFRTVVNPPSQRTPHQEARSQ
jgi:hypothetical protein